MYCPSCGVAVLAGLRFCNHCGAQLTAANAEAESKEISPGILIAAMTFSFVFGIFAISLLVLILNNGVHLERGPITGFAGLSFLILAVLEAVFITLLFRRKTHTKEANEINQSRMPRANELRSLTDKDFVEQVPSVTEHTTRAFDYVPNDQAKKMNS